MLGIVLERREQREDQIDRLVVHRLEAGRLVQAKKDAAHAVQARQSRVRQRHAVTHAGGSGRLAFEQRIKHDLGVEPVVAGRDIGDRRQNLPLAAAPRAR